MTTRLNPLFRALLAVAGLMLIYPGLVTDLIGIAITVVVFVITMAGKKSASPA